MRLPCGQESILYKFKKHKITREEMADQLNKIMLVVRPGMEGDLERLNTLANLEGSLLLYSLWEGYKGKEGVSKFLSALERLRINSETLHTSGHADIDALRRMVDRLQPRKLVPIHTFHPDAYATLFNVPVQQLADGALLQV